MFGDPGILASKIYNNIPYKKKYELGILAHSKDLDFVKSLNFNSKLRIKIINPRQSPSNVAKEMLSCEHIVSSSLHGLIFSDSFRIPNLHIVFSDKLVGGYHKFDDYYLGMNSERFSYIFNENSSFEEIINLCSLRIQKEEIEKKSNSI